MADEEVLVPDPEEDKSEGNQGDKGQQEPELILGKFKSHEDLAKSYQELERKLGTKATDEDAIKQAIEQRDREWQQYMESQKSQTDDNDDEIVDRKTVKQLTQEIVGGIMTKRSAADTNRDAEIDKRVSDPLYPKVAAEYRRQMRQIPDDVMVDPRQAEQMADFAYAKVVGDYVIKQRGVINGNPVAARTAVKDMFNVPDPDTGDDDAPVLNASAIRMFEGLGLSPKQMQEAAAASQKREKEAKNA